MAGEITQQRSISSSRSRPGTAGSNGGLRVNHELQMNTVLVNRKNSRIMAQEMKKQEERRTGQFILIGSTVIFIALSAGKVSMALLKSACYVSE